jgi:hypothetical protein
MDNIKFVSDLYEAFKRGDLPYIVERFGDLENSGVLAEARKRAPWHFPLRGSGAVAKYAKGRFRRRGQDRAAPDRRNRRRNRPETPPTAPRHPGELATSCRGWCQETAGERQRLRSRICQLRASPPEPFPLYRAPVART